MHAITTGLFSAIAMVAFVGCTERGSSHAKVEKPTESESQEPMSLEEASHYLFEELPLPDHWNVIAEAGYPDEFPGGIAIRRQLLLDVSELLPEGLPKYPSAIETREGRIFYGELTRRLRDEAWAAISRVIPGDTQDLMLANHAAKEEGTEVFYNQYSAITIRSEFDEINEGRTLWEVSFVAVVYRATKGEQDVAVQPAAAVDSKSE